MERAVSQAVAVARREKPDHDCTAWSLKNRLGRIKWFEQEMTAGTVWNRQVVETKLLTTSTQKKRHLADSK